jgi:hypothetical protein
VRACGADPFPERQPKLLVSQLDMFEKHSYFGMRMYTGWHSLGCRHSLPTPPPSSHPSPTAQTHAHTATRTSTCSGSVVKQSTPRVRDTTLRTPLNRFHAFGRNKLAFEYIFLNALPKLAYEEKNICTRMHARTHARTHACTHL